MVGNCQAMWHSYSRYACKNRFTQYSGKISLRFSPFVHEQASGLAKKQGINLNQYINDAIVYYNSMLNERNTSNSKSTKSIDKTSNSIIQFGQS